MLCQGSLRIVSPGSQTLRTGKQDLEEQVLQDGGGGRQPVEPPLALNFQKAKAGDEVCHQVSCHRKTGVLIPIEALGFLRE